MSSSTSLPLYGGGKATSVRSLPLVCRHLEEYLACCAHARALLDISVACMSVAPFQRILMRAAGSLMYA
jgi:hypothetical protein